MGFLMMFNLLGLCVGALRVGGAFSKVNTVVWDSKEEILHGPDTRVMSTWSISLKTYLWPYQAMHRVSCCWRD